MISHNVIVLRTNFCAPRIQNIRVLQKIKIRCNLGTNKDRTAKKNTNVKDFDTSADHFSPPS